MLGRVARGHPIAAVIVEKAGQHRTACGSCGAALHAVGLQTGLNGFESLEVEESRVLGRVPGAVMTDLAQVSPVLQEIGERTMIEVDPALGFPFDDPPLGLN